MIQDRYHVCLVMPEGYIHSMAFKEVAMLLVYSFYSLGIVCSFKLNCFDEDAINIILGYHLIKDISTLDGLRYIPYQLEQLTAKNGWYDDTIRKVLLGAYAVWDYAQENIDFLKTMGIQAKLLVPGYHEKLEIIKHQEHKDIDVLFYGCLNERRRKIIDALIAKGYKVVVLEGVYGMERDAYIARSKIVLNIHFYESQIFEAVRVSYLLNNNVLVISEDARNNNYAEIDFRLYPYSEIVAVCDQVLSKRSDVLSSYIRFNATFYMPDLLRVVL